MLNNNKPSQLKKRSYSYQDCWNHAFSLPEKSHSLTLENDIITLCGTSPEKFWSNFTQKNLSFSHYQQFCQNFYKYFQENYPVPYLTKQVYFYQSLFQIKKGVFIPQKETEILIEKTLALAEKYWLRKKKLRVLEIGTGCGNIALSLAKIKPSWEITATDISKKALQIAQTNAQSQQIKNVKFLFSNLFTNLNSQTKFDIIISNPPYVSQTEYKKLPPIVKKQPKKALLASENGIFFYRKIFSQVNIFLNSKFLLAVEISPELEQTLLKLIINCFSRSQAEVFSDYNGQSRVILVKKNGPVMLSGRAWDWRSLCGSSILPRITIK